MNEQEKKSPKANKKAAAQPQNLLSEYAPPPKKEPPLKKESAPAPENTEASAQEKKTAPKKAENKDGTSNGAKKSTAKADTKANASASPKREREQEKPKKDAIDLDAQPRSAKTIHRFIPYALIVLAVMLGVALLLNLICNRENVLESTPELHPIGPVGYYVCYALFGVFGPAVFVLPLLLLNLAFFWRRYIDNRLALSKALVSALFLLMLGAVIHIFCLRMLDPSQRDMSAAALMHYGAEMTGGGVLGGALGAFLLHWLNFTGSLILGILLLGFSLFYIVGTTPERLWELLCTRRELRREMRRAKATGISEQDAELAFERARMQEKLRRVSNKQPIADIDGSVFDDADTEKTNQTDKPRPKKNPEDRLAPMPKPHLNPGSDDRLFVPGDVNRKMHANDSTKTMQAPALAQNATASAAVAAPAAPQKAPDPAQNRDTAIDPIFPKSSELATARKTPKADRSFDLGNVFINLDDKEQPTHRHAPVPPEVPPKAAPRSARPAAAPTPTAAQKPTAPVTRQTAQAAAAAAARPIAGKAPSLSAVKPQPAEKSKTIFRQATSTGQAEFGLSNEEFEKLEAERTGTAPKRAAKPVGAASSQKSTAADKKTTPAPKAASPKKYVFPPISYLQPGVPMTAENRAEIEASMHQLAATLESFRVRVQEINYSCGPTVTRYEVVLSPGVRVRNVTNLADDIALALRSSGGVRIEAPIPGTNAVGIEVPNKTRSTIYLRDMIEARAFTDAKSKLSACLGADIAGKPIIFDIAKMPHLLIAGTTGSGKSVCINCIIMSLLYKVRPDEVRLVLIDPKKVEFSIYKNIPHLMAPVVTQPKDAAGALQAAVEEMERRFEVFESVGVRDLKGYNEITKNDPDMPFIPHIVIIIDELADLMMTARTEVETAICRIAQKARAAGMHLIIGTQRPSADVVTGLIKANVPSSIAFAVKSQIDSRVILDHGGAEALTGRGDMLFVPIGSMRDTRVQGAFVDDKEVEKICEFIRVTNGTAQYDERFTAKLKELAAKCGNKGKASSDDAPLNESGERGDDPKYEEAIQVALEENRVATSLLQRKLGIGYSRAAKIIDRMQAEGIVSAPDGSKPRSILITREQYLDRMMEKESTEKQ